jgi:hypothetical protein
VFDDFRVVAAPATALTVGVTTACVGVPVILRTWPGASVSTAPSQKRPCPGTMTFVESWAMMFFPPGVVARDWADQTVTGGLTHNR